MNIITALLIWIGAIGAPTQASEAIVNENQDAISTTISDPNFLNAWDEGRCTGIVVTDLSEMD